jgi:hypothetical protein
VRCCRKRDNEFTINKIKSNQIKSNQCVCITSHNVAIERAIAGGAAFYGVHLSLKKSAFLDHRTHWVDQWLAASKMMLVIATEQ